MRRIVFASTVSWALLLFASLNLGGQQTDDAAIEHYSEAARDALSRKDPEAALTALGKLARLTPNNADVFANLGAVNYTQGHYAEATEAYKTALRLDPQIPQVPLMLGMCYMELGQVKEAIPMLEQGFQNPPSDEVGRSVGLNLLSAYMSANQPSKGLELTGRLLDRYPNDPEVLYRASHLYGDMALKTMTHLVDVAPQSVWKRMSFAEALESEKRYDLAIIEYRKAVADEPDMAAIHYQLGRALLLRAPDDAEARDEGLKEFEEAVKLDPHNSAAEYEIGEIHRRQGQFTQAREHFSRAVTLDPTVEDAQIALARTLIRLQRPEDSVPHLLAAIELNPKNEVSHFLLANAYRALGNSTGYENEMAHYKEFHSHPVDEKSGETEPASHGLALPGATKQTMDSETKRQP